MEVQIKLSKLQRCMCLPGRNFNGLFYSQTLFSFLGVSGSQQSQANQFIFSRGKSFLGSKGWRRGESPRLPPMWSGLKSRVDAICGLSLLLVLSFAPRGFSPCTLVFPSPQKPTLPNSNSTRNKEDEELLCGCATSKSLFYLFIYLIKFPV